MIFQVTCCDNLVFYPVTPLDANGDVGKSYCCENAATINTVRGIAKKLDLCM